MEPDSLSAESAFPPPPPLLPPPLPPPVAPSRVVKAFSHSLWRWNDRLALVVGGLTLFLLGIVTGRVFGPDTARDGNSGDPVAVVSAASQLSETASVIATEAAASEEVNPPESPVYREPAERAVIPVTASSAETIGEQVAEKPATTVQSAEVPAAATSSPESVAETSPVSSVVAPQTTLVSLESKVLTIKPPAATQVCEPAEKYKDRKLSTALTWTESVDEATQQAEQDEKLVFLIHVSGNFEMPGFT